MKINYCAQHHPGSQTAYRRMVAVSLRTHQLPPCMAEVMSFLKPTKAELEAGTRRESAERRGYRMELIAERLTADHQPTAM